MHKDEVFALIASTVSETLPGVEAQDLRESDSMADLGADSMVRAEIVMRVLEQMDLDIPLIETHGPRNLGELAETLSAKCR